MMPFNPKADALRKRLKQDPKLAAGKGKQPVQVGRSLNVNPNLSPPGGAPANRAQAPPGNGPPAGVPGQLRSRFGSDWRGKAYGGIEGYRKGLASKIQTETDPAKKAAMSAVFAKVQARRRELTGPKPKPISPPVATDGAAPVKEKRKRKPGASYTSQ